MTTAVNAFEAGLIQADYNATFPDECQLGTDVENTSAHTTDPDGTPDWSYATAIPCGVEIEEVGQGESDEQGQATITNAKIRLPVGAALTGVQRIRVTKRYGTTLGIPEIYAVDGSPLRGAAGLWAQCRRVVGESMR